MFKVKPEAFSSSLRTPLLGATQALGGAPTDGLIIVNPMESVKPSALKLTPPHEVASGSVAKREAAQAACRTLEQSTRRNRLMLMTDSVHELLQVPAQLAHLARQAGVPFVCLDSPDRLDDLLQDAEPTEASSDQEQPRWRQKPGPLQRILDGGGWVYIHYEQFAAAEAESLNDLFAERPTFRGRLVHPEVMIFGAMMRTTMRNEQQSEAFVSRYGTWRDMRVLGVDYVDPLSQVQRLQPADLPRDGTQEIQLFGDENFAARLCARPQSGPQPIARGALRQALAAHNTVVLRNAPWADLGFCMFMRELLHGTASDLEGPLRLRPGQRLLRCDGYADSQQALGTARFSPTPSNGAPGALVLTSRNFGQLHESIDLTAGIVRQSPGILARLPAHVPLRVVANLLPHQWQELAYGLAQRPIFVDPAVPPPHFLQGQMPAVAAANKVPTGCLEDVLALPQGSSCIIVSDDVDADCHTLQNLFDTQEVFDVSEHTEAGELVRSLRRHERRYHFEDAAFWRALSSGKTVILRNLACNANLTTDLLPLLQNSSPALWCEDKLAPLCGRLLVVNPAGAPVSATRALRVYGSNEQILRLLQGRFSWVDAQWVARSRAFLQQMSGLKHQRTSVAGRYVQTVALLSKVAAVQQAEMLIPMADPAAQARALAAALLGSLSLSADDGDSALCWLRENFPTWDGLAPTLSHPKNHGQWEEKLDVTAALLRRWPGVFLQAPRGLAKHSAPRLWQSV